MMTDLEQPAPSERELDEALADASREFGRLADKDLTTSRLTNLFIAHQLEWLRTALPGLLATARDGARLVRFAGEALQAVRVREIGDWDGGAMEAAMLACGLLEEVHAAEPCGESCRCREYDAFPQTCYRVSTLGNACLDALDEPAAARSTGSVDNG